MSPIPGGTPVCMGFELRTHDIYDQLTASRATEDDKTVLGTTGKKPQVSGEGKRKEKKTHNPQRVAELLLVLFFLSFFFGGFLFSPNTCAGSLPVNADFRLPAQTEKSDRQRSQALIRATGPSRMI